MSDRDLLSQVSADLIRDRVYALAGEPRRYRKLNYTMPGHEKCSLYEADDYLQAQLESFGYSVEKEPVSVQAYRCDTTKPKSAQYSPPMPEDPSYTAYNLYARKTGTERPDEIIVIVSHKDSQSWVDSPGANDNAVGTAVNLELARLLGACDTRLSLCFLYCNEEHTPWTSATAANNARERGDNIIAVFNVDSIGRKSDEDHEARVMQQAVLFTEPEGEPLVDLLAQMIERHNLPISQTKTRRERPGDDDGSFVKAGYPASIMVLGSYPYADPQYHTELDTPDRVDVENAALSAQSILAAILELDRTA